jgi:CHASE2 domain-containing sensor protein
MSYLVVLNLGKGDWQRGLPTVIAQLWDGHTVSPMQFIGSLPAVPTLGEQYQRWRSLYEALYSHLGWRRSEFPEFEIDETDVTHVSRSEFDDLCQELSKSLNCWLSADSFRSIDRQLRTRLSPRDTIRFIIVADDPKLLQLPWHLWDFLEDYPNAEIALSPPQYMQSLKSATQKNKGKVRILVILGNSEGINLAKDRQFLQQLPNADLKFLIEPAAQELNQQLWEPGWDILFFAGHSSSQGKGTIQINQRDGLTIDQLKYGLRQAIAHGLKLAIFNSCDGLGLALNLADLYLPQVIVMREPVPDRVAQEFLKQFLAAFSGGRSLYSAVREAREKLQALETEFPCATWLPVICQNPAETPPTWQEWSGQKAPFLRRPTRRDLQTVLLSSLVITGLVAGVRWLGALQPLEIWAYDRMMRLRPAEVPDDRLLVITVTEQDIQAQGNEPRRGSLSDRTLNRLLNALEPHQPLAIGLDIYRDFAAEQPELATQLRQNKRLIAICKRPDSIDDPIGVLPPPEVPSTRLAFSDFVQDNDGVIRRHLLYLPPNPSSACTTAYALSTQLAFRYLKTKGISPQFTAEGNLKLGDTVFPRINRQAGGYHSIDAQSGQILLNYRAAPTPQKIAQQATLSQVLDGQVNPKAIRDRIVLIGIATPSSGGDYWATPYGTEFSRRIPGVLIHAQMASQMLSAVLDQRPLIWVWSEGGEIFWIGVWSLLGGVLGWQFRRLFFFGLALGISGITLSGLCFLLLVQGGWVPFVPSMMSLLFAGSTVTYLVSQNTPNTEKVGD